MVRSRDCRMIVTYPIIRSRPHTRHDIYVVVAGTFSRFRVCLLYVQFDKNLRRWVCPVALLMQSLRVCHDDKHDFLFQIPVWLSWNIITELLSIMNISRFVKCAPTTLYTQIVLSVNNKNLSGFCSRHSDISDHMTVTSHSAFAGFCDCVLRPHMLHMFMLFRLWISSDVCCDVGKRQRIRDTHTNSWCGICVLLGVFVVTGTLRYPSTTHINIKSPSPQKCGTMLWHECEICVMKECK